MFTNLSLVLPSLLVRCADSGKYLILIENVAGLSLVGYPVQEYLACALLTHRSRVINLRSLAMPDTTTMSGSSRQHSRPRWRGAVASDSYELELSFPTSSPTRLSLPAEVTTASSALMSKTSDSTDVRSVGILAQVK